MTGEAIHRAGLHHLLIDLPSLDAVIAFSDALRAEPLPGQVDLVPASRTVLLEFTDPWRAGQAASKLPQFDAGRVQRRGGKTVKIPVVYDGDDLHEVAAATGRSVQAVVQEHHEQMWTAAFSGFAPGFAYLVGDNNPRTIARRTSPRTKVPAGSVGLAGEFSAVYPSQSPGGWQLIGHTDSVMWDERQHPPALIAPGDRVQFIPTRASASAAPERRQEPQAAVGVRQRTGGLRVLDPGIQTLYQDAGRRGYTQLGVPTSGAADTAAAHQANELVGNHDEAVVLENLMGGLRLEAVGDHIVAQTGAETHAQILDENGSRLRTVPANSPLVLLDGQILDCGPATRGLRSYLSVRGGFDVEPVLGSASTDVLSDLGPQAVQAGDVLSVQRPGSGHVVGLPGASTLPQPDNEGVFTLRVVLGPREHWFGAAGVQRLLSQRWHVSADSNRIGIRFTTSGAGLERIMEGELPSEGMVRGSLQVPPSGLPVLFVADVPVTGGYPVIAVVLPQDVSAAAQLPPGSTVRFAVYEAGGKA